MQAKTAVGAVLAGVLLGLVLAGPSAAQTTTSSTSSTSTSTSTSTTTTTLYESAVCHGQVNGTPCLLSDARTQGTCLEGGCQVPTIVAASEPQEGIGTLTATGLDQAITGTDTAFETQVTAGDLLTVAGQELYVAAVGSDTALTVSATPQAFSGVPYRVSKPLLQLRTLDGQRALTVDAKGRFGIGYKHTTGSSWFNVSAESPLPVDSGNGPRGMDVGIYAIPGGGTASQTPGDVGGQGGFAALYAGSGGSATEAGDGGAGNVAGVQAGDGGSSKSGTAGAGGRAVVWAGNGGNDTTSATAGAGGNVEVLAGDAGSVSGGTGANGGDVVIAGGAGSGAGTRGFISLQAAGGRTTSGDITLFVPGQKAAVVTGDVTIDAACATQKELTTLSVATTAGKEVALTVTEHLANASGASRDYQLIVERGGTGCGDATAVDADAVAKTTIADGAAATVTWTTVETSPGGSVTYRVCACASASTAGQTAEHQTLLVAEY